MTLALIFAFELEWGVAGLWAGFTIACIVLDIGFFFIITCCDWEQIGERTAAKMEIEEQKRLESIAKNKALTESERKIVIHTPNTSRARLSQVQEDLNKSKNRGYN